MWIYSLCHELAAFYHIAPQEIERTWTLRQALLCQRYVMRDKWRERRTRVLLAGGKFGDSEPDWFGVSYGVPVAWGDFEKMKKQWEANVQPEVNDLTQQGAFKRDIQRRKE